MAERLGWRRWSLWNVQHCSRSPPSHPLPPSLFPAHLPPLSFLRQPPLCLTLSRLRASICLQSFPPSPLTPPRLLLPPRFPLFPCLFPSCSVVPSQFDWSRDWCSYQSPELSLVRDNWTQRRYSPLATSLFYLPQSPSFNKFVPVNKPSKMTPSP